MKQWEGFKGDKWRTSVDTVILFKTTTQSTKATTVS